MVQLSNKAMLNWWVANLLLIKELYVIFNNQWAKHMQRDKTYSDLISDTFLYFGYFTRFFFQLSLHSQVHFNNSPCPDWPLWWIIGLNTQIKTPRSDYHVTSLYSIHTLYSKQVMRTLKLIRYNLQYYLDWNLILIINLQGNV